MQRERSIHQDLLSQVADDMRERDEVRRILSMHHRITDAELTKHNARRTAAVESAIDTRRQHPRTLRDAFPDPAWREGWQSAEAAAAEEEHIRAQFDDRPGEPLGWRVLNGLALGLLASLLAWVAAGYFGWLP